MHLWQRDQLGAQIRVCDRPPCNCRQVAWCLGMGTASFPHPQPGSILPIWTVCPGAHYCTTPGTAGWVLCRAPRCYPGNTFTEANACSAWVTSQEFCFFDPTSLPRARLCLLFQAMGLTTVS